MKRIVILAIFLVSSTLVFSQQYKQYREKERGFYADLGLVGFGGISYFGGNTKLITDTDIRLTFDNSFLTLGWAVTQSVYVVCTTVVTTDMYFSLVPEDSGDTVTINNGGAIGIGMYGIGTRFYPLPSKKYLQLGLDLGISQMSILHFVYVDKNLEFTESESDVGFSSRFSAAWDVDSTMTGFTVLLGGALMMNIIENEVSLSYSIFLKLAYK